MRANRSKRILVRTATLLLLFAVAVLATVAKQGQYLAKSDALRCISKAVKMELLHHPVDFPPPSTYPTSRIVPPQPGFSATRLLQSERLKLCQSGLTASFRHRAPPFLFA